MRQRRDPNVQTGKVEGKNKRGFTGRQIFLFLDQVFFLPFHFEHNEI